MKHLSQDSQCPSRDPNRAPPKYKSTALPPDPAVKWLPLDTCKYAHRSSNKMSTAVKI
jgi:hypothetical protein